MVSFSGGYSTTDQGDYTELTVDSGSTVSIDISTGDVFENYLIDISNSGAVYDIQADGSNWTIRNIGVTGNFSGGHTEPFRARVTDSNGEGIIENVYFAGGNSDSNATGLYVYWNHAGHLDINQMNVQDWTDNGIYASGPGNSSSHSSPGAGGTVSIRNSYSKDNDKSNFRLGTSGSTLENCCAAGGSSRGHWQFYESAEIIDCDLDGNSDIALGDAVWSKSNNASVTCTNSRWSSETSHGGASTNNINGTSVGNPQDRTPDGCPTTALEAASGEGGSSPEPPEDLFTTALTASDTGDEGQIIVHDEQGITAGETLNFEIGYHEFDNSDFSVLVSPDNSNPTSDSFTGYMFFIHSTDNLLELIRMTNGSRANEESTSISIPTDEVLTGEIDFRETNSDDLTFTLTDSSDFELGSVTLTDTQHQHGYLGFYRYHSPGNWEFNKIQGAGVQQNLEFETLSATNITGDSVTVRGEITDMTGYDEVQTSFVHRESGGSWTETSDVNIGSEQTVTEEIAGLDEGVTYDYRFIVEHDDGGTRSFTTQTIDIYEAFGAGDLNDYQEDTGDFELVTDNTSYGNYALTRTGEGHSRITYPDGNGPVRGSTFAQDYYPADENADILMAHFAVQGGGERYAAVVDNENGRFRFWNNGDGETWRGTTFDTSGTGGQWNTIIVDFGETNNDEIHLRYEDSDGDRISSFSVNDTEFDGGGWGYSMWRSTGESNQLVDNLRNTDFDPDPEPEPPEGDYTEPITIDPDEERTVVFEIEDLETGEYDWEVIAGDLSDTGVLIVSDELPEPDPPSGDDPPQEIRVEGSIWIRSDL